MYSAIIAWHYTRHLNVPSWRHCGWLPLLSANCHRAWNLPSWVNRARHPLHQRYRTTWRCFPTEIACDASRLEVLGNFSLQHALHPPTPVVRCTEYPIPLPINSPISSSSSFSSRPNPLLCLMTIAPVSPVCFVIRRQLGTFYSNASGLGRCLLPLAMVRILLKFAKSEPMDP